MIYDLMFGFVTVVMIGLMYVTCSLYGDRMFYENAFRAEMAQSESMLRTIGRGVDPAYICKSKTTMRAK
jgi:hypothetical protein